MNQIESQMTKLWRSAIQQYKHLFRQGIGNTVDYQTESGSVVVLVALALTTFLGFCAIVTDVGLLYAQKAHLQNSVDAAALAAVQELPYNPSDASDIAIDYAARNGVSIVNVTFEEYNAKIIVEATQQVPTSFARIWGINEELISVSASAKIVPPEGLFGAVPLSIQEQNLIYGQKYVLKYGGRSENSDLYLDDNQNNKVNKDGQESGTPGWYGALELSGTGARSYEEDLAFGYQGTLRVGQILNVKHGNMSGPTSDAVTDRLSRDTIPYNTIENYERDAPQILYIPIIKIISEIGNSIQQVQIIGFAAFFLEGVAGNGNDSEVTGWFIKTLVSNQISAELPDLSNIEQDMLNGNTSSDFSLYTAKLVAN